MIGVWTNRAIIMDIELTLSVDNEVFRGREIFVDKDDVHPFVERAIEFSPD